jgi:hypothetical protein
MSQHALLTVEDVSKTYDGFKAITNLNFYLFAGLDEEVWRHSAIQRCGVLIPRKFLHQVILRRIPASFRRYLRQPHKISPGFEFRLKALLKLRW